MAGAAAKLYKILQQKVVAGSLSAGAAAYVWYYLGYVCKVPELHLTEGSEIAEVLKEHCPSLYDKFRPTPWAWMSDAQTLLGMARGATIFPGYDRQILKASDGGTIALDWFRGSNKDPKLPHSAPVLLVMHGLNGGSFEGYCKWMCEVAAAQGWRTAVINYRGCGGLKLTSPKGYSAAFVDDIRLGIDTIKEMYPTAPLAAVGYSLGSMLLTKYCSVYDQTPSGSHLKCAMMISNPFCAVTANRKMEAPFTMRWVYNLALTFVLKKYIHDHKEELRKGHANLRAVNEVWTLRHFDEQMICELFDYNSLHEYHQDASSVNWIGEIKTPSLFLIAKDDPFLGRLPIKECNGNPNTALAVTERGGHVAFLQGMWPFTRSWMDVVATEFFTPFLQPPQARL